LAADLRRLATTHGDGPLRDALRLVDKRRKSFEKATVTKVAALIMCNANWLGGRFQRQGEEALRVRMSYA
jgi:hypothetical protein